MSYTPEQWNREVCKEMIKMPLETINPTKEAGRKRIGILTVAVLAMLGLSTASLGTFTVPYESSSNPQDSTSVAEPTPIVRNYQPPENNSIPQTNTNSSTGSNWGADVATGLFAPSEKSANDFWAEFIQSVNEGSGSNVSNQAPVQQRQPQVVKQPAAEPVQTPVAPDSSQQSVGEIVRYQTRDGEAKCYKPTGESGRVLIPTSCN